MKDTIKIACPHCNQHISVDSSYSRKTANCPTCNGLIPIPAFTPSPLPEAASASSPVKNAIKIGCIALAISSAYVLSVLIAFWVGYLKGTSQPRPKMVANIALQPTLISTWFRSDGDRLQCSIESSAFLHHVERVTIDWVEPLDNKVVKTETVFLKKNQNGFMILDIPNERLFLPLQAVIREAKD